MFSLTFAAVEGVSHLICYLINLTFPHCSVSLSCTYLFTAVKAKIQNKYLHNDGQNVYLDLHVYHIYRQLEGIFLRVSEGSYHIGRVRMLGKCSPQKGRHHYIFLGKKEKDTKDAQVECYMKFSLWKMIKHQIKCSGSRRRSGVSASKDIKDVYYQSKR